MKPILFVTGNPKKAEYLQKYLGIPIEHKHIDLDEIQSLNLREIVEHKVKQAYKKVGVPVLVEDASLQIYALGQLPGPFIKFFIEEIGLSGICELLSGKERDALSSTIYGYYDGERMEFFEASHPGKISDTPRGENGYGWDKIYEPDGYIGTRAELNEKDHKKNYLQIKPLEKVREFLLSL